MNTEKITDILPKDAFKKLTTQQAVLIDVRSTMEYDYIGYVPASILIPLREAPTWDLCENFTDLLQHALENLKDVYIIFMCRSGHRSLQAAQLAQTAGFKKALNMKHGFEGDLDEQQHRSSLNGWRFDELPWMQT